MTLYWAYEQFVSLATVRASANCTCVTDSSPDDATVNELIDQASDAMVHLTAGKIAGRRTITARPCRVLYETTCSCGCRLDAIPLEGPDPVVSEVKIDGVALSSGDYTLHSGRDGRSYLVRVATTDRPDSWPSTQSSWRPDTEDDTFSITYTYGHHVDWITERAALELVCDFAADDVRKTNQMGAGTTSANMGGVTVGIRERMERLAVGAFGQAMERFLTVYGPDNGTSEVWAPELETWSYFVEQ